MKQKAMAILVVDLLAKSVESAINGSMNSVIKRAVNGLLCVNCLKMSICKCMESGCSGECP